MEFLHPLLHKAIALVGGLYLLSFLVEFVQGFYARFLRGGKNLKKAYGEWAIVTGATDGIGLAMAEQLAKKGLNLLLISRSDGKLSESKNEILAQNPNVEVRTLQVDYSSFDEASRKKVAAAIADLPIGVLVNNVGMSYPFTKYFDELNDTDVSNLISLNVDSTTWMTRICLPGMLQRKKGAIVNISSIAGISNSPLLAQYGAAKSYIAMFSRTLNAEYASKGIHVQCQVPMLVATKLAKIKKPSLFIPSPKAYAAAAVKAIGFETVVSPYWSHAIQVYILTHFPEWLVAKVVLGMHLGIRKAGMKKEQLIKEGVAPVKGKAE